MYTFNFLPFFLEKNKMLADVWEREGKQNKKGRVGLHAKIEPSMI